MALGTVPSADACVLCHYVWGQSLSVQRHASSALNSALSVGHIAAARIEFVRWSVGPATVPRLASPLRFRAADHWRQWSHTTVQSPSCPSASISLPNAETNFRTARGRACFACSMVPCKSVAVWWDEEWTGGPLLRAALRAVQLISAWTSDERDYLRPANFRLLLAKFQ